MMAEALQNIPIWQNVDDKIFLNQIVPEKKPAVLKSLISDWTAVKKAKLSTASVCNYINQFDTGKPVSVVMGNPEINGRFFYSEDLRAFNFQRKTQSIRLITEQLLTLLDDNNPPSISIQGMSIKENLDNFIYENKLPLLDSSIEPRMWIGNKVITATHYDLRDNIACVVAGKRRFTLFPPEQIENLYMGPLSNTPSGAPVSMVDLTKPDFDKFPRFKQALDVALTAEMEPGDAIYIPHHWWHHVESLNSFNILVNYWWDNTVQDPITPYQSLLHSLLTIPKLSIEDRKIWSNIFKYFVFRLEHDPLAHLPEDLEDIISSLPLERKDNIQKLLAKQLVINGMKANKGINNA
jgi:oxalate decarboxylase/phosphoglucose isomerase-like protein (cupin superfamily)